MGPRPKQLDVLLAKTEYVERGGNAASVPHANDRALPPNQLEDVLKGV